tara:strand:- start:940 stop:1374 length:435 start_codon:yes stop_codon:yes gene_type:complete
MSFEYHKKNMGVKSNEITTNDNILSMEEFLVKEHNSNKTQPWNKLNKTNKNEIMIKFINSYATNNNFDSQKKLLLQTYLLDCIKKNKITKKDIDYDSEESVINNIPELHFVNNKFSIKFKDNRVSASRGLPKKILNKTIKNKEV